MCDSIHSAVLVKALEERVVYDRSERISYIADWRVVGEEKGALGGGGGGLGRRRVRVGVLLLQLQLAGLLMLVLILGLGLLW